MLQLPLKTFIYFQSVLPSLYLCQAARLPICRWWNTVFARKNYTSGSFEELTWLTELCHIHLNNNKQLKANKNLQLSQMSSIISALFVFGKIQVGGKDNFLFSTFLFLLVLNKRKKWICIVFVFLWFIKLMILFLTSIRTFRGNRINQFKRFF